MISKKILQNNYLVNNNKTLRRIISNNLFKLKLGNFSIKININFSHLPNGLPMEDLKFNNKKSFDSNNPLNDLLLSKLNSYTDSISFPVLKQKLTSDLEQIDTLIFSPSQITSSSQATKELRAITDSIKTFKPYFINEFIENLTNEKAQNTALTLEELEIRGNELNDKLFLNEFPNQNEIIDEIIFFLENFVKFLYKFDYYNNSSHAVSQDDNKIYNLKKFEFIRNVFESLNFELINNAELLRILPCIVILDRIYCFSALTANAFNAAVTRLIASQHLFGNEQIKKEEKVLLAPKNQKFLKNFILYNFLSYGNLSSFSNNVSNGMFPNFEALLAKLVYLKSFIAESADLNELVFLITQNILNFTCALGEMHKLSKNENKKLNKQKAKNLCNLFNEFIKSYSTYLIAACFKQGNSVKSLDTNLLRKYANALILIKKAEQEYPDTHFIKNDEDYQTSLRESVDGFLFKNVLAKQSILSNFILKSEGFISLIELDDLFKIKNFDAKINQRDLKEYCSDKVEIRENAVLELLTNAVRKYQPTNINKNLMNLIFSERLSNLFFNSELPQISEYLIHLQKFQVKTASDYFDTIKSKLNSNLTTLDLETHFKLLYTQTKLNIEQIPLKSPLYVTFLLKISEQIFNSKKINPIKLAWVLAYHSYLDLNNNVVLEESLKNLIKFMQTEQNWVNEYEIEEILEVLIMVDSLKLFDVKIPKTIVGFFDKEIIANLISNLIQFTDKDPKKNFVFELLEKEQNVKVEYLKFTNVFYVDALVEYGKKKTPLMFVNDYDYNSAGELRTGLLLRKKHFEDYFKTKVAIVNPQVIKTFNDLSKSLE